MLAIALPVAFQQPITASLNMINVLLVGQLGETSVAALGLANQIFFLLILFLSGVTSGMPIFTSKPYTYFNAFVKYRARLSSTMTSSR
jgi:Na+-driven multidrug efflux pump